MDVAFFETAITERLKDLGARLHDIDDDLGQTKDKDLGEQAIDLEDDEVLESLGAVAQTEIGLLVRALARIKDGTYGICQSCKEPISQDRLKAVLYAPLCQTCANQSEK